MTNPQAEVCGKAILGDEFPSIRDLPQSQDVIEGLLAPFQGQVDKLCVFFHGKAADNVRVFICHNQGSDLLACQVVEL